MRFDEISEPIYYIAKVSEDYERQLAGDNDFGPNYIWEMKNKQLEERKRVEEQNEKVIEAFNQLYQQSEQHSYQEEVVTYEQYQVAQQYLYYQDVVNQ